LNLSSLTPIVVLTNDLDQVFFCKLCVCVHGPFIVGVLFS
jgi:hypothetical protein